MLCYLSYRPSLRRPGMTQGCCSNSPRLQHLCSSCKPASCPEGDTRTHGIWRHAASWSWSALLRGSLPQNRRGRRDLAQRQQQKVQQHQCSLQLGNSCWAAGQCMPSSQGRGCGCSAVMPQSLLSQVPVAQGTAKISIYGSRQFWSWQHRAVWCTCCHVAAMRAPCMQDTCLATTALLFGQYGHYFPRVCTVQPL